MIKLYLFLIGLALSYQAQAIQIKSCVLQKTEQLSMLDDQDDEWQNVWASSSYEDFYPTDVAATDTPSSSKVRCDLLRASKLILSVTKTTAATIGTLCSFAPEPVFSKTVAITAAIAGIGLVQMEFIVDMKEQECSRQDLQQAIDQGIQQQLLLQGYQFINQRKGSSL